MCVVVVVDTFWSSVLGVFPPVSGDPDLPVHRLENVEVGLSVLPLLASLTLSSSHLQSSYLVSTPSSIMSIQLPVDSYDFDSPRFGPFQLLRFFL